MRGIASRDRAVRQVFRRGGRKSSDPGVAMTVDPGLMIDMRITDRWTQFQPEALPPTRSAAQIICIVEQLPDIADKLGSP